MEISRCGIFMAPHPLCSKLTITSFLKCQKEWKRQHGVKASSVSMEWTGTAWEDCLNCSADSSETSVRLFFLCISSMVGDVLSPKMSHPWSKQALKQNNSLYDLYAIRPPLIVIRRWIIHKEEDYKKGKRLLIHWRESRSRESGGLCQQLYDELWHNCGMRGRAPG